MDFEKAFKEAVKKLKEAKKKELLEDFLVIGAIALSRVATVRSTGDIDFAIKANKTKISELTEFLDGESREGDVFDPLAGCITFNIGKGASQVNIQLIRFHKGTEDIAFMEPAEHTIKGQKVPFASWKALLLLKLYAGSAIDLQDAENILRFNPCSNKDLQKLETSAQKLRLSRRLANAIERSRR